MHVTDTGYVVCQLVRRTQHARALQALGLQKDSAGSDADAEEPSARTPIKLIQSDAEGVNSNLQARRATPWTQPSNSSLQQPDSVITMGKSEAQVVHQSVRADADGAACDTTATDSMAGIAGGTADAAGNTQTASGNTDGAAGGTTDAPDGRTKAMSLASPDRSKSELPDTLASAIRPVQTPAAAASSLDWPAEIPTRSSASAPDRQVPARQVLTDLHLATCVFVCLPAVIIIQLAPVFAAKWQSALCLLTLPDLSAIHNGCPSTVVRRSSLLFAVAFQQQSGLKQRLSIRNWW